MAGRKPRLIGPLIVVAFSFLMLTMVSWEIALIGLRWTGVLAIICWVLLGAWWTQELRKRFDAHRKHLNQGKDNE